MPASCPRRMLLPGSTHAAYRRPRRGVVDVATNPARDGERSTVGAGRGPEARLRRVGWLVGLTGLGLIGMVLLARDLSAAGGALTSIAIVALLAGAAVLLGWAALAAAETDAPPSTGPAGVRPSPWESWSDWPCQGMWINPQDGVPLTPMAWFPSPAVRRPAAREQRARRPRARATVGRRGRVFAAQRAARCRAGRRAFRRARPQRLPPATA